MDNEKKINEIKTNNPELWKEVKDYFFKEFEQEGQALKREHAELTKERDRLTKALDDAKAKHALRLKRAKTTKLVEASGLPSEAVTQTFMELQESQKTETAQAHLIAERLLLCERFKSPDRFRENGHVPPDLVQRFSRYGFE